MSPHTSPPLRCSRLTNGSFSDGTCVRDYLHVVDLAQGHVLALDALSKGDVFPSSSSSIAEGSEGNYKAYNLGRGQAYSVLQIIEAMRKATGYEYQYEIVGRRSVSFHFHLSVGACGDRAAAIVHLADDS